MASLVILLIFAFIQFLTTETEEKGYKNLFNFPQLTFKLTTSIISRDIFVPIYGMSYKVQLSIWA